MNGVKFGSVVSPKTPVRGKTPVSTTTKMNGAKFGTTTTNFGETMPTFGGSKYGSRNTQTRFSISSMNESFYSSKTKRIDADGFSSKKSKRAETEASKRKDLEAA